MSVGNDTNNLTKHDRIQITDTTIIEASNSGMVALTYWKIICNDENNNGKQSIFLKTSKSGSPTGASGATSLIPIGSAFMHIETSSIIHGKNVLVSFKQTLYNLVIQHSTILGIQYQILRSVQFKDSEVNCY